MMPEAPPVEADPVLRLSLPAGWRRTTAPRLGIVVAARAPRPAASGFTATVVLDRERLGDPGVADVSAWQARSWPAQSAELTDLEEEDADAYTLGDIEVLYRRYGFRSGPHLALAEQWCWLVRGLGLTLTCTTTREDYPEYADLFEDLAGTLEVLPAPGAG